MVTEIAHSTLITFALVLSFMLSKSQLAEYDLQIAAFLFLATFIGKRFFLKKDEHRLVESLMYTFIIMTIVNTTGGLQSPYFFLLYFLLFALSLFLEPVVSVTTTIGIIFFSLLTLSNSQDLSKILPILSLALITPFALFLGQEHYREKRETEKVKMLTNALEKNKEDSFLFLSLVLKNHVRSIINTAENYLGDHHLEDIKKNAQQMEQLINQYEDQKTD